MATYQEDHLINGTSLRTTTQNEVTNFGDVSLSVASTQRLTLRGAVYGGTTTNFNLLGGARVTVYDSNGVVLASTTTVATGSYTLTFEGRSNVPYTVIASATGYEANYGSVTFDDSLLISRIFLLLPDSNINTIYGTIIDTNGVPIGGANISITNGTNTVLVTTLGDGTFIAYDGFTAGQRYTITVSKLGYGQTSQTITYPANTNNYQVILTLTELAENYTAIIGKITIAGSSPTIGLGDALVGLYVYNPLEEQEILIATQKTDQFGNYAFTNVAGGNQYRVRAIRVVQVN